MQIVALTTWFPTDRHSGAGSFIARDVAALSTEHDVRVIHLVPPELDDGQRHRRVGDVEVRSIPVDVRTPRGLLSSMRGVPTLLEGADVVHTMAAPALLPFLFRRPTAPWVHTEHWSGVASLGSSRKARAVAPLIRRAFSAPDRVVAVSEYLAASVRRLRRGEVDVIGNIVDLPDAPRTALDPVFRGASLKVLGVGTVNAHKGWRVAADAVSLLGAEGLDAELVWLGTGPEHGELAGLDPRAIVAPGLVGSDAVASAMQEADVFVLPTISETFSLATLEALCAGTPVVTTGVGAHTSFLTDETGLVVPRTAADVAAGIRRTAGLDRSVVAAHGARLAAEYDEPSFLRRYARIYEEVTR